LFHLDNKIKLSSAVLIFGSRSMVALALADKIKTIVSDKVKYCGRQS